jgi:hypothetical protein
MTDEAFLRDALVTLEVNEAFSEAVLGLRDGSRLHFRHRVGERRAWATGLGGDAGRVLAAIALFRLNGKHLDVSFQDGSRWEALFRAPARRPSDPPASREDP